jgi:hypothetical protein
MTGTYVLRLPGDRGERSELLGASLTGGIPTLHLHPDADPGAGGDPECLDR